ncbi:hypothetical protein B0H66DRAFT_342027 [Apodospora peruviana]|uniref:Chorismate synthase protein n=1 Tax=Apodospora peruviana TaxID=516989 RepID=A0AAE0M1A4_9PEZI|nr:hypothetical protein B0H66DRAFT_342027 [Apodospora peruviana]
MVSQYLNWGTIKSLLIFFGPILLPKAIAYYRSYRNAPRHNIKIQPLPSAVFRSLLLLAAVSTFFLIRTLPILSPENVFTVTQSRLQIPADVLFTRLATMRANGSLSDFDTTLRAKFVNMESRLLYLQFGPSVLADCPFCAADDSSSYLYYAVPDLLAPHLLNWAAIAVATSAIVSGRYGSRWRTYATIAAIAIATTDIYLVSSYNYQANRRATRLQDLYFFYWRARVYRAAALAGLDALLAAVLYLTATHRAFVSPPSPAERVEMLSRVLSSVKGRVNAVGVVKNTANRDEELHARSTAYWNHEVRLMQDVMEEREVIEGVNDALQNRIDITTITRDADAYVTHLINEPTRKAQVQEE